MTLCAEMDQWLAERQMLNSATVGRRMPGAAVITDYDLDVVPPCPLTAAEIDWLWPRYQRCNFPPATFAKRFAQTDRSKLTPRGMNAAASLAYRYRRQIFGKAAVKWSLSDFLAAVRTAARLDTNRPVGLGAAGAQNIARPLPRSGQPAKFHP
ncbi:MAG TPA: hypothetical protein PLF88_04270 [Opitutaceae bacterium]|nr:hypothetical protein [Opitutaceae bacterium]HRJ47453.1 hypothetical protein [Opitutaceae bacterium]